MADQSDVETALADLASAALYPQGVLAPSAVGAVCRIYRGWPNSAALDADMAAGMVHVTVFPAAQAQRNTTRWPAECAPLQVISPTLTIAVAGEAVTLGGTADQGQVAGILADNMAVVHRTVAGDTPELVAAVLTARLRTERVVTVAGAQVIVPGAFRLIGRVVADQKTLMETRRQVAGFRLSCWCPDPATRDSVATLIDSALSMQTFIALADGTQARLRYLSGATLDESQNTGLYRRDLVYEVEYATTAMLVQPSMIFGDATLTRGTDSVTQSFLS
jgi:hypothetical protein